MESFEPGDMVWVKCEVKPGPFTNERLVRVGQPGNWWVGFIPARALQNPDQITGEGWVGAQVVEVDEHCIGIKFPGPSLSDSVLRSERDQVSLSAIQA